MYFILATADFSGEGNNIGTLDSWFITYNKPNGITWSGISSTVDKSAALNCTAILDTTNYELTTITIKMGDTTLEGTGTSGNITVNVSEGVYSIAISEVTANVNINIVTKSLSGGDSEGDDDPTPDDTEIGTTTTFGSTNIEVTIIGTFSDFDFVNNCVVSTGGGSSCTLNTAGASGRISSATQILKVSGGETITFSSSISGLQYALIEFTDKPCTLSTLNKNGLYGQSWSTAASCTLHSDTKYLAINFNNGSSDMTADQLTSLKTAIVLS